jgi:hypothetical protein
MEGRLIPKRPTTISWDRLILDTQGKLLLYSDQTIPSPKLKETFPIKSLLTAQQRMEEVLSGCLLQTKVIYGEEYTGIRL